MKSARAGNIRQRLAEGLACLERIDLERLDRADPGFSKALEERIIWGELLDLELQLVDEQIERTCAATGNAPAGPEGKA